MIKHNLPRKVIFCKRCVVSNQRPRTSPEFNKRNTDISTISFGDQGICDPCRYYEIKNKINWDYRSKLLESICDKYRKNNENYDVIVPGSGGKDSIYAAKVLKEEYGMNPLTVTWAPHLYTEIGKKNLEHWSESGFDNYLLTPKKNIHSKLTRLAFLNLCNPFQPFILGQKIAAVKVALKLGIKFLMYGENQGEVHNSINLTKNPIMDPSHFTIKNDKQKINIGGYDLRSLHNNEGIHYNDLSMYIPPSLNEFKNSRINVYFLSHFKKWSPHKNYYYVKQKTSFEQNPIGRSEGTYTRFSSLDDKIDGQHYYTTFIKFGIGRATADACRDIRDNYLSRIEAINLVKKFDGEFPELYFQDFLNYIKIDEDTYWKTINNNRSSHLWEKVKNKWKLKHQVS